jgi:hypothetical protein
VKSSYKYTVDDTVIEFFSSAKKRHRDELLRIFATLADNPVTQADWTQKDSNGRDCQVKRFARWVVTYWPEHLANLVHIIDVEQLL